MVEFGFSYDENQRHRMAEAERFAEDIIDAVLDLRPGADSSRQTSGTSETDYESIAYHTDGSVSVFVNRTPYEIYVAIILRDSAPADGTLDSMIEQRTPKLESNGIGVRVDDRRAN